MAITLDELAVMSDKEILAMSPFKCKVCKKPVDGYQKGFCEAHHYDEIGEAIDKHPVGVPYRRAHGSSI